MGIAPYSPPLPEHDPYEDYRLGMTSKELKELCEKFPTVDTAWTQFKTVLKMCESEFPASRKGVEDTGASFFYAPYIPIMRI